MLVLLEHLDTLEELVLLTDLALKLYKPCAGVEYLVYDHGISALHTPLAHVLDEVLELLF